MMDTPRIYVADLAAYNAGTLRGVWIDATKGLEEIQAEVQAMLAGSPEPIAEEWALHDHEGFGGIYLSEWTSFEEAHGIALLIEEHGALGAELVAHWYHDVDEVRRLFDDGCYLGVFDSVADYAQEITEETTEIPEHLQHYVDYASYHWMLDSFCKKEGLGRKALGLTAYLAAKAKGDSTMFVKRERSEDA